MQYDHIASEKSVCQLLEFDQSSLIGLFFSHQDLPQVSKIILFNPLSPASANDGEYDSDRKVGTSKMTLSTLALKTTPEEKIALSGSFTTLTSNPL